MLVAETCFHGTIRGRGSSRCVLVAEDLEQALLLRPIPRQPLLLRRWTTHLVRDSFQGNRCDAKWYTTHSKRLCVPFCKSRIQGTAHSASPCPCPCPRPCRLDLQEPRLAAWNWVPFLGWPLGGCPLPLSAGVWLLHGVRTGARASASASES